MEIVKGKGSVRVAVSKGEYLLGVSRDDETVMRIDGPAAVTARPKKVREVRGVG